MKRTRLCARSLPAYSVGEETMNTVTHIVGGGAGILALAGCLIKTLPSGNAAAVCTALIYCISMILVYTISSVYHGLKPGTGKKVLQVMDHCAIYLLIAGSYTPIAVIALAPVYPVIGWGLVIFQWSATALAITLTAIDLRKYRVFSMICYICCGWAVLPFIPQTAGVLTKTGFLFLFWGGIAYTLGAILYGIGSKKKWFHCIFHIFVVLGSVLQLICIFFYVY
ncbi:MAG: hemolysin III family protein [Ruminococcaceae bacterium]|nr:hemolysin III family protein [Oscillospiraceae bacterium]